MRRRRRRERKKVNTVSVCPLKVAISELVKEDQSLMVLSLDPVAISSCPP